jgi:hypothetical protein
MGCSNAVRQKGRLVPYCVMLPRGQGFAGRKSVGSMLDNTIGRDQGFLDMEVPYQHMSLVEGMG